MPKRKQLWEPEACPLYGCRMPAPGAAPSPASSPTVASAARARRRRFALPIVGVLLLAIALDVAGAQLPVADTSHADLASVALRGSTTLARFESVMTPGQSPFLAVEPAGEIDVVDRVRRALLRFAPDGRLLSAWGPRLSGDVDLQAISGVAVRPGQWFLVDRGSLRILELDAAGRLRRSVRLDTYKPYGPNGLAVDGATLYLADTGRSRVLIIGADEQQLGSFGSSAGEAGLKQPMALAFGPDGALFVADWENARIGRWVRDDSAPGTWTATNSWSVPFQPFGVAVDRRGRVYAPDMAHNRILVYAGDGAILAALGGGATPLPVDNPVQVAVGADGASLVVLGADALGRVDLEDVTPPPRTSPDPRLPWLGAALGIIVVLLALILWQQRRATRRHM